MKGYYIYSIGQGSLTYRIDICGIEQNEKTITFYCNNGENRTFDKKLIIKYGFGTDKQHLKGY